MLIRLSFFLCIIAIVIKLIAIFYTNFDLFGDEAQYWVWSKDLNLGYYSKPPFLPWVIALITGLLGNDFWVIKIIPTSTYLITPFVIYLIAQELYKDKKLSILCALSFYLMPAVSVSSFLLSTDIFLIFFWSLCLLFTLKIKSNQSLANFFLLGIFLGLALLSKYAGIYFIVSLIVFLFFDNDFRKVFYKNYISFFVFILTAFFVFLPNIVWNINNGWLTFVHTSDNAALSNIGFNIKNALIFILSQVVMIGPLVFLFFFISLRKLRFGYKEKFLLAFSAPIFLIIIIESFLVRANANWAAVAFVSFFILTFSHLYTFSKKILLTNNVINFLFCLSFFILITATSSFSFFDRVRGFSSLATSLEKKHLEKNSFLVVEDRLLFSNLKYYLRESSINLYTSHSPNKKIGSHFHITDALPETFDKKFIFLGHPSELSYLKKEHSFKIKEVINVRFQQRPLNVYEVIF